MRSYHEELSCGAIMRSYHAELAIMRSYHEELSGRGAISTAVKVYVKRFR